MRLVVVWVLFLSTISKDHFSLPILFNKTVQIKEQLFFTLNFVFYELIIFGRNVYMATHSKMKGFKEILFPL